MPEGIELIPKEIAAAKERQKLVSRVWLIAGLIFLLSGGASAGLFLYKTSLSSRLSSLEQESAQAIQAIAQFSNVEEKALALEAKSTAIPQVLSARSYFSKALSAIETSRPSGVSVTGVSASTAEESIIINGETPSYSNLSTFLDNLIDEEKGGTLFTQASLTSVNFDPSTGDANFAIEAVMSRGGLEEPLPGEEQ
ncbi:hypothetical protein GTO10_05870 [Candidatus Saccharibacteria bacterium]|nr:hypothetical protein [Candidatus Saccharibacteria bacterium]